MHRKDALDADAETDAPHRERFAEQLTAAAHDHALKRLDALFIALALFKADINFHRIAGTEIRMILANLGLLRFMNDRIHDIISRQTRSGGASTQRTISNSSAFTPVFATAKYILRALALPRSNHWFYFNVGRGLRAI